MKKLVSLLLTIVLVASLLVACNSSGTKTTAAQPATQAAGGETTAAAPVDDGQVYEMNVSFASPEFTVMGVTASLDRIQEASNGRIKFNYYYSWSLSSVPTVVDDLNSGVVDIAAVPVNEHLNLFPYSNLITYTPFLPLKGMRETATAFTEMYEEFDVLKQEFANAGLHYWTNYPCPPYHIFTTDDKQIKKPGDLAGLKIITSSKLMSDFITANGGAVVNSPVTDYATNLNTNVVDGVINHINVLAAFGCLDFIGGVTVFGDSGTAMSLMMMCISESAWSELPDDLKALFNQEAPLLLNEQCDVDMGMQEGNFASLEANGVPIVKLTEDEIAVWRNAFTDHIGGYIEELVAGGTTEAQTVYDAFLTKIGAK